MRVADVPQDESILEGHRRACYAQDATGRYVIATSRGWEVERIANQHAVAEVQARIDTALDAVRSGRASPLAYHMARFHMDAGLLAAHSGIWAFRVRRHLRPDIFARLPDHLLRRYADVFKIDIDALRRVEP